MSRTVAILLAMFVFASAKNAQAQDYKGWWKYLEGEWTYVITSTNGTPELGTATWKLVAKESAMRARFVNNDKSNGVELSGWQSDSKTLVANGYGSRGNYWVLELDNVTAEGVKGPAHGVMPDGTTFKGMFTGKKVSKNSYEWNLEGKTGAGKDLVMTGKYSRMSEPK